MKISKVVEDIIQNHDTHNPFEICRDFKIPVVFANLIDIRGFCIIENDKAIINVSNNLDDVSTSFVCAHELGHIVLHPGVNRVFLDKTFFVASKYEIEADRFAVDLLFDDYELHDFLSSPIEHSANYMGVSVELAEYRMKHVMNNYFS